MSERGPKMTLFWCLCALLLAIFVTIPKLWSVMQIRGWIDGASYHSEIISQKWYQDEDSHPANREAWWIAWQDKDIKEVGGHRVNISEAHWQRLNIGEPIIVITLGDSPIPYLEEGIYASNGNLMLDIVLLIVECWCVFYFGRAWLKLRSSSQYYIPEEKKSS